MGHIKYTCEKCEKHFAKLTKPTLVFFIIICLMALKNPLPLIKSLFKKPECPECGSRWVKKDNWPDSEV